MHQLRCILAAFLAILIAAPACCCASVLRENAPAKHSCCSGGKKEKRKAACDCEAKTPRNHEAKSVTLDVPPTILPEPAHDVPTVSIAAVMARFMEFPQEVDTGPPRWRLAVFQRLLI